MSLARATFAALTRQGVATVVTNVLQVGQYAVLGRLVAPEDFGVMTMATVVSGYASLAADAGLSSATVQSREEDPAAWSTLFWLNVGLAVVVAVFVALASPVVAAAYGEPRVSQVLALVTLVFPLTALGQQHQALAERALRFDVTARADVLSTLAGVTTAVGAGYAGLGVFALVVGTLVTALVRTVVLVSAPVIAWRPALVLDIARVGPQLRFGGHLMGQRTFNYLTANLDFLVVGRFVGSEALGYYAVAYNLANLPASRLNQLIGRVFFPAFSRIQADVERLRGHYLRLVEASGMVTAPVLGAAAALAPMMLPALLGERWRPSVPLLQVLCLVGLTRALAGTVGPVLLARGRSDLGFKWSLLAVAVQAVALWAGLRTAGVLGVALGFAAAQVILVVLTYVVLVRTLVGECARAFAGHVVSALALAVLVGVPIWLAARTVAGAHAHASPSLPLIAATLIAAAVWAAAIVWTLKRHQIRELVALVASR